MNRTKKTQVLISLIGEAIKKHEIIDIINMNDKNFNYYYENEINLINNL